MKIWTRVIITIGLYFILQVEGYCPIIDIFKKQEYQQKDEEIQEYREIWRIVNIIKQIESGGNYKILGKSGEYGAYQFKRRTWERLCMKFAGEVLSWVRVENQDWIAFQQIKWLKSAKLGPQEIASYWNCGSKYGEGKKGINKYGQRYDVERYIKRFMIKYND